MPYMEQNFQQIHWYLAQRKCTQLQLWIVTLSARNPQLFLTPLELENFQQTLNTRDIMSMLLV